MKKINLLAYVVFITVLVSCTQEPPFPPEEIDIEGKQYELTFFDDFDKGKYSDNWRLACYIEGQIGKRGDYSNITQKIGDVGEYNSVKGGKAVDGVNAYTEDGVMHIVQTREFDETTKNWTLCTPAIESIKMFPVNSLIEVKFKMEVKGQLSNYQIYLNPGKRFTVPNDKGYTFKQLFACELISGIKNKVKYTSNIWLGTKEKEYAESISVNDFNGYDMPDEKFYEWHIARMLYTDTGFYVWHDGLQTFNYNWDSGKYGAPDCDVSIHLENNTCGEWSPVNRDWMGKMDTNKKTVDYQIDYVKVYNEVK